MKILITGANGFIAKNLIYELKNRGYNDLCFCNRETAQEQLDNFTQNCDFVFHLAGVNRPDREDEFTEGNVDFTEKLMGLLEKHQNKAPIVCTSSTQAILDNSYGKSKLAGEELILSHEKNMDAKVFVYRLTNVFGKWCRPNYNSAVATFCYNTANDLSISISDENREMQLVYIDDVVEAFIEIADKFLLLSKDDDLAMTDRKELVHSHKDENQRYTVNLSYFVTLGNLVALIKSFKDSRTDLNAPNMSDIFTKKLYSTYLSYLPEKDFSYPLKMNVDKRGSFTEILKSQSFGQVSVNISKPDITKGNHWHHTKNEKFLVVSGNGVVRFRKIGENKIIEYYVSGEKLEVIDIPPGYTHNITNLGQTDMVTVMWANEGFDSNKPDTYFLEV